MHTFERKLPKSSSFFFRGVSSSVVSAMASLRINSPQPRDDIVAGDTKHIRDSDAMKRMPPQMKGLRGYAHLICPMAVFCPVPTTTALARPAVTTVPCTHAGKL